MPDALRHRIAEHMESFSRKVRATALSNVASAVPHATVVRDKFVHITTSYAFEDGRRSFIVRDYVLLQAPRYQRTRFPVLWRWIGWYRRGRDP